MHMYTCLPIQSRGVIYRYRYSVCTVNNLFTTGRTASTINLTLSLYRAGQFIMKFRLWGTVPFRFSRPPKRPDIINGYKIPLPNNPIVFVEFRQKIFPKTRSLRVLFPTSDRGTQTNESPWDCTRWYCMHWG